MSRVRIPPALPNQTKPQVSKNMKTCISYTRNGEVTRTRFFTSGEIIRSEEKNLRKISSTVPVRMTKEEWEAKYGPVSNPARLILQRYEISLEEPTMEQKRWREEQKKKGNGMNFTPRNFNRKKSEVAHEPIAE